MLKKEEAPTAAVPIGLAAETLGVHARTLRLYEQAGLVKPSRRHGWRYYTPADITWLRCLRDLVHVHKISLPALARLLQYEACWEIRGCRPATYRRCEARRGPGPCWEQLRRCCQRGREVCVTCELRDENEPQKD